MSKLMEIYSIEEGEELVRAARKTLIEFVSHAKFDRQSVERHTRKFTEKHGVFVRVEHWPTRTPRGSMGFVHPRTGIGSALLEATIGAAEDKDFVPISHREIEHIVVEVDVLSEPEELKGSTSARLKKVKSGRDGIIATYGFHTGIVLPIEASENDWKKEEILEHACMKAGLSADSWKRDDVKIHKFTSQVFRELSPDGPIEEIVFG